MEFPFIRVGNRWLESIYHHSPSSDTLADSEALPFSLERNVSELGVPLCPALVRVDVSFLLK